MQRNEVIKVGAHDVMEIEWKGQRVITTAQLADVYETDINNVQANFGRNVKRFEENVHYFFLEGDDLRAFKNQLTDSQVVPKHTAQLYLWTHRGASRHCKILDTEKAWEQFDNLEEAYFNPKTVQQHTITYQYPISPASLESATNAGRLFEYLKCA